MNEEDVVLECIQMCKDSNEKPRCISLCCKEKGVDPIKGVIIAAIYEENFLLSTSSPLYYK